MIMEQMKSVKLTSHVEQQMNTIESESDEFNELLMKVRDKITHLQNNKI